MNLVTSGVGRVTRVLTTDYVEGRPFTFIMATNQNTTDANGNARQITSYHLCNLWPRTYEKFENFRQRIYVGNMLEVRGVYDPGTYQDKATGNYMHKPCLNIGQFQVLAQMNPNSVARQQHNQPTHAHYATSAYDMGEVDYVPPVDDAPPPPAQPAQARPHRAVAPKNRVNPVDLDDDLPF